MSPTTKTEEVVQAPPTMSEMIRMSMGLGLVCLIAAVILGGMYMWTEPAKEHNVQLREKAMIQKLLNLSDQAEVHEVRRYLFWRGRDLEVLYLTNRDLLRLDASGTVLENTPLAESIKAGASESARDEWAKETVTTSNDEGFNYVGRFFMGFDGGQNAGYVIEGVTAGYKTWIRFFLAIDADFSLKGLEVIEHEEDPGLGAEITERYFKNQFSGRSFEDIKVLKVIKDPLPSDWKKKLEQLGDMPLEDWLSANQEEIPKHPDIHAITGSTISSVAVADGVKRALRNFRKRMDFVEKHL